MATPEPACVRTFNDFEHGPWCRGGLGMSSEIDEVSPVKPEDVVVGDPLTTIWRWCIRNSWTFVPSLDGSEAWVDLRCVWQLVNPSVKFETFRTYSLKDVQRVNGLVRLSDVMDLRHEVRRQERSVKAGS